MRFGASEAPSNGTASSGHAGAVVGATKQPAATAGAPTPGRAAPGGLAPARRLDHERRDLGFRACAGGRAPATTPLAVVTGFDNYKLNAITTATLAARLKAKTALVPVRRGGGHRRGAQDDDVRLGDMRRARQADREPAAGRRRRSACCRRASSGRASRSCRSAAPTSSARGRSARRRTRSSIPTPTGWTRRLGRLRRDDVRVILTTGVNCADRGVSRQTNTFHKGWAWLLNAGTARYTGTHFDSRLGWTVVDAVRTGNLGAIKALIKNADIAMSDFECAMSQQLRPARQRHGLHGRPEGRDAHEGRRLRRRDDRLRPHDERGLRAACFDTVKYFEQAGIKHVGAGANLAAALKPAVIDVRGLKFAFYALNGAGGSVAGHGRAAPGTARLTTNNIKTATRRGPQGRPTSSSRCRSGAPANTAPASSTSSSPGATQMFAAGTDHVIGADFHWAGALSITPGGVSGNHLAIASEGNFWFGQDWSRQTEEGYMTMITFVGTRLAQVRLIPTVVLDNAQPNLTNPATDGQFVLKQALTPSIIKPK